MPYRGGEPPLKGWVGWPKRCPGTCGNLTRPWNARKEQFPNTRASVNKGGWCDPCRRASQGKPMRKTASKAVKAKTKEIEDSRVAGALAWRLRYEADRRRRGVPTE